MIQHSKLPLILSVLGLSAGACSSAPSSAPLSAPRQDRQISSESSEAPAPYLPSCKVESSGESFSGTLVAANQLLIAGHSDLDLKKARIFCRCGSSKAEGLLTFKARSTAVHPAFISSSASRSGPNARSPEIRLATDEIRDRNFSDVQLVTLETPALADPTCVSQAAPATIVPSLDRTLELLAGDCSFAASGVQDFRVTHVPTNSVRTQTPDGKREVLFYINSQTPKGMQYLLAARLLEMKRAHFSKQVIKEEREKAEYQILKWSQLAASDDAYGTHSYLGGDSGGSLFCTDPASRRNFLVGVLTDGQQDVVLLAQPAVKNWLDPLLTANAPAPAEDSAE